MSKSMMMNNVLLSLVCSPNGLTYDNDQTSTCVLQLKLNSTYKFTNY